MSLVRAVAFGTGPLAPTGCHLGQRRQVRTALVMALGILLTSWGLGSEPSVAQSGP